MYISVFHNLQYSLVVIVGLLLLNRSLLVYEMIRAGNSL